jgi:hypothetical protein
MSHATMTLLEKGKKPRAIRRECAVASTRRQPGVPLNIAESFGVRAPQSFLSL